MELISGIRDSETSSLTGIQHVPISGSQTIALPPFFNIKSANLKMMDVIGQGKAVIIIGASLSEPHINGTALREICVYMYGTRTTITFHIYAYSNLANCKFILV